MAHFLGKDILVFDGGVSTELYSRGFYINRPFEELNLTSPADVEAVYRGFIEAGSDVITTNTFGIASPQLARFDIAEQQPDIIEAALKIARKATAGKDCKVGFSIGPIGDLVEPLGSIGLSEVILEFAQIAKSVNANGGADFFILETFSNLDELRAGINGVRSIDKQTPILASIYVRSQEEEKLKKFAHTIGDSGDVQALGINCGDGPSDLLRALGKLLELTSLPIIVQPNAGLPRQINGRYFYMTSPDYLGKFAKRYASAGATGVGGCCGTGPSHIAAIKSSLAMAQSQSRSNKDVGRNFIDIGWQVVSAERPSLQQREASRVGALLAAGKKFLSVEILPPIGLDVEKFQKSLDAIESAGIPFVNIPDGARASTRMSSLHISSWINDRRSGQLKAIPHFTTRDRNLIALQSDLIGAHFCGVKDVLVVTGDPPKLGNNKEATAVYDIDSIGLTYMIDCLNRGVSPMGEKLGSCTQFGIGVASNPTAINLETEIQRWKYKVESGCDYAITQPIFDPEAFLAWKDSVGSNYRPHFIGIWPLISLRNAEFMANEVPGIHVPTWVIEEMSKAGDNKEEAIKRGIEIAQKVMHRLDSECEGYCISAPLGKVSVVLDLLGKQVD